MKGKELLYIVISSFVLTVIWIASNVYHSYVTSTIDPLLQIQIVPIAPNFDMATIERLKERKQVAPISGISIISPTISPTISPSPEPSQAPEIVPSSSPTEPIQLTPSVSPSP